MTNRAEVEQLKETIGSYDFNDLAVALDDMRYDLMPKGEFVKDPGKKCSHGQDGCIGKKQFTENLEMIIPDEINFLSAHFLSEGASVQRAIAMVTLKVAQGGLPAGNGWGSGSLISNSLFLTNNHVIPEKAFCNDVNMQFGYQDNYDGQPAINSEFFETNEKSFFHTNPALDYTIVRLKRKPYRFMAANGAGRMHLDEAEGAIEQGHEYIDDDEVLELQRLNDVITHKAPISSFDPASILPIFGYTPGSKYGHLRLRTPVTYPEGLRMNLIQHPRGRKKEVVVQDNELKDVHTNVIHYTSDTDYGSSGSPVFNNKWDLMALHHARKPSETANEGIRIDRIVADLRSTFQTSNPAILSELGI